MAEIAVSKVDAARMQTLMSIVKRGKFELEGEEVLAFAQAVHWLGEHLVLAQKALAEELARTQHAQREADLAAAIAAKETASAVATTLAAAEAKAAAAAAEKPVAIEPQLPRKRGKA